MALDPLKDLIKTLDPDWPSVVARMVHGVTDCHSCNYFKYLTPDEVEMVRMAIEAETLDN